MIYKHQSELRARSRPSLPDPSFGHLTVEDLDDGHARIQFSGYVREEVADEIRRAIAELGLDMLARPAGGGEVVSLASRRAARAVPSPMTHGGRRSLSLESSG